MENLSSVRVSALIGSIYDCVADPTLWPVALRAVCEELCCMFASIMLWDLQHSNHRTLAGWNHEPFTTQSITKYSEQITAIYKSSAKLTLVAFDDPLVLSRDLPEAYSEEIPYYREMIRPLGMCDAIQSIVLRDAGQQRLGVFAANRHMNMGLIGDREIEILRLLAPHIRRAATISDLINLEVALDESLISSLNMLCAGVILAAADGRIAHANRAAEQMFNEGGPVRSRNGFLAVNTREAQDELLRALMFAQQDEAKIGTCGIGVPLPNNQGFPAIAHVLPLKGSVVRARLAPRTAAAIFVVQADQPQDGNLEVISRLFGLTRGECRVLAEIVHGAGVTEAGNRLGVSEATARTHVQHIFRKTGVSRQAELIRLIANLISRVRLPDKG